jgi:hypothetical protein
VFDLKGQLHKQNYVLDPVTKAPTMLGQPVIVRTRTVNAAMDNLGLVAQVRYGWVNMAEAAATFIARRKTGNTTQLQPDFAPVALTGMGKIVTDLAAAGISPIDFAVWTAEAKTKAVGGKNLPKSAFAYVGDKNDTSTWKLPVHDSSHARNALARINQSDVPGSARSGVLSKIRQRAGHMGVDVSDEPTTKQKTWKK